MIYNHTLTGIFEDIANELQEASFTHPDWPTDVVHAVAIMNEEAGESIQAALDLHYAKPGVNVAVRRAQLRRELIQTAAMCVRNLIHIRGDSN